MASEGDPISLVEDYLGVSRRSVNILVAIGAGTLVVTTGIYIGIYGFQHWKTNMRRAGEAMVIDYATPATVPAAAQYVCTNCRVVGVPVIDPGGAPRCRICGGQMSAR